MEWMTAMTAFLQVQWSEVWNLPLWLWRQYVEYCRDYIQKTKELSRG